MSYGCYIGVAGTGGRSRSLDENFGGHPQPVGVKPPNPPANLTL